MDPDLIRLAAEPVRRFASAGTLSEPDLAAQRGDSAHRATWHGRVILVDTGPIVAVINDRDDHHWECRYLLERLPGPLLIAAQWLPRCV